MNSARLQVRAPFSDLDCVETADAVFDREGFVAASHMSGINRFYTPRASVTSSIPLRWGIAVTINGGPDSDTNGQCLFVLQALSKEDACGISCPLTPQPGYDDVTRKMATLLHDAFRSHPE
jgi:hypothetical protein